MITSTTGHKRGSTVRRWVGAAALLALAVPTLGDGPQAPPDAPDAPAFSDDGRLLRPEDYREWIFLSSGLGMTYGPARAEAAESPRFDNVFVTRPAYREFRKSGTWPERTMLILEVRHGEAHASINNGGRTQGGLVALEAAVKDRSRFPDGGWGFFSFDGPNGPLDSASALPRSASCYSCHERHGAVDHTFVQFYPTAAEVARRHGTFRAGTDPAPTP